MNPLPVPNPVSNIEECDDDTDGSAQNGFYQNFDLESQTAEILGNQDPNQFTVTYHTSFADAALGITPLQSPFSNSTPNVQTIFVRVANGSTGCANGITSFDVIVLPEPDTFEVSNLSTCDDDLDGDHTNGIVQNFDLDSLIPGILGADQDPDDFTVTFHQSQADASSGDSPLTSPYSNELSPYQQTIYTRVVNNSTLCVNDDFTFEVIVYPLPVFTVETPQIICLNDLPYTLNIESALTVYDYEWIDPSGSTVGFGTQVEVSTSGMYTVIATTTDGTACSESLELELIPSSSATMTMQDVTIADDLLDGLNGIFSVTINPANLGIGDYEYALVGENDLEPYNYQDIPVFEEIEGGFYTILVRDKNGCGVVSLDIAVVEFPRFFTPNNDNVNDTWAIKGANSTFFPGSEITIFNRFGKIVAQIDIDEPGWDGTFNGKILPSDDYWFSVKLVDIQGNIIPLQGNFSLLIK